jgi:hypothetical protein
MPQEIKNCVVGAVVLYTAITAGILVMLLDPHGDWLTAGAPLLFTLALFLPMDLPDEDGSA